MIINISILIENTVMKLNEIFDFDAAQRTINLMKQNAQRQVNRAKEAQARLNMKKSQQKLLQAKKPLITVKP
jgi:hypothetical protein